MEKRVFPLSVVDAPIARNYHEAPRKFGSRRDKGRRLHAGCDLYAEPGTAVMAVADGTVVCNPYLFYDGVYALEVKHPGIGIVRYGEIYGGGGPAHTDWLSKLKKGDAVTAGQVIGHVGKMGHVAASMVHFELYSGDGHGPLTVRAQQKVAAPVAAAPPSPLLRPPPVQASFDPTIDLWALQCRTMEDLMSHDQDERTVAGVDPPLRYELYMRRNDLVNPTGFLDSLEA
jgi:murein DD-endopeptidase MepM/ murein hydrolase activator NlpD